MPAPKLKKRFPEHWYQRLIHRIDTYILSRGQEVKHISRTQVVTNQYHDIVYCESHVQSIMAIIVRSPGMATLLGFPFGQFEDEGEVEVAAYFPSFTGVKADDIIVVESQSLEGELDRDTYLVLPPKSIYYEREVVRRFLLAPLREQKLVSVYSSEELDAIKVVTEGAKPGTPEFDRTDFLLNPGGFLTQEDRMALPVTRSHPEKERDPDRVPESPVPSHKRRQPDPTVTPPDKLNDPDPKKQFIPVQRVEFGLPVYNEEDPFERFKK